MGKKSSAPEGPSYSEMLGIQTAQFEQNKEYFDEYMDFTKSSYADQKALSDKIMDVQLPAMQAESDMAELQRERYKEMGIPQEDAHFKKLTEWDSPERRERSAATARGDIATASEQQRLAAEQTLRSKGVDPSQVGGGALDKSLRQQQAAQMALAGNQARTRTEQEGMAYSADAVNMAKGMPAMSGTALQLATNAGQTAFGNQSALGQAGAQPYVTGTNMNATNSQSLNQAYGTAGNLHRNDLAGWQMNAQYGPGAQFGQLAGAALGAAGAAGGFGNLMAEGGAVPHAAEGGVPITGMTATGNSMGAGFFNDLIKPMAAGAQAATTSAPAQAASPVPIAQSNAQNQNGIMDVAMRIAAERANGVENRAEGGTSGSSQQGGGAAQPAAMPRPASQGIPSDNQATMLTPGEFVIPDDVARWEGEKSLQKIINKAREDRVATEQQRNQNQASLGIPV